MKDYLDSFVASVRALDRAVINGMAEALASIRDQDGRVFVLGSGGSAANASHAAADFRKLCFLECYSPSDNVAELTARVNDDGWPAAYVDWLRVSRLSDRDGLLILSVGGGSLDHNLSPNLVRAIEYGNEVDARTLAIVGRADGYAARYADVCLVASNGQHGFLTPISESLQAAVWHLLAGHPLLRTAIPVWEDRVKA
ncbi:SIS domain-containing protein [Kribbella monticola]|uniref:SIS domain-containing protein n=1 Tax=Kribbella monticola TaxID=2185285 RepID=UPI0018E59ADA|nr:SIS domain-containing protein [Kribbella monticola]